MSKIELNANSIIERIGNIAFTKTWKQNMALLRIEEALIPTSVDHNKRLRHSIEQIIAPPFTKIQAFHYIEVTDFSAANLLT